jgi:hypothetical protein
MNDAMGITQWINDFMQYPMSVDDFSGILPQGACECPR